MIVRDAQPADQARVFVRATALKNTWHEATAHVGPDGLRWRFDANVWIGASPEDEWRYATEPADVDDLFDPMFIKNETHSRLPPFERNTERRTVPYEDHAALEAEVERLRARVPDPDDLEFVLGLLGDDGDFWDEAMRDRVTRFEERLRATLEVKP